MTMSGDARELGIYIEIALSICSQSTIWDCVAMYFCLPYACLPLNVFCVFVVLHVGDFMRKEMGLFSSVLRVFSSLRHFFLECFMAFLPLLGSLTVMLETVNIRIILSLMIPCLNVIIPPYFTTEG